VLLDLDASSKKRVFEQAGMLFEARLGLARSTIFDSLFAREKLGSTGLGQGVAIPHGRIKGLKQAAGAFMRLANPVPFDSPDGRPVDLLFVCWCPSRRPSNICRFCPSLAQRFSERTFREKLQAASRSGGHVALFQG
jgi:PTS system nitrogen regulatory IIA component